MNLINLISRHLKIKVVVVLLAVFIWFFVEMENNYRYSFEIPIHVSNLPPGKIVTNKIPENAKITIWGKGRELLALTLNRKLYYHIDLINTEESTIHILDTHNIRLPRTSPIEVINIIEPDSIYLEIAELQEKKVPVHVNAKIELTSGYTIIGGNQIVPDSVLVVGPPEGLDSTKSVETEIINLKNAKRDVSKRIKLIQPHIKFIEVARNEVNLFVNIQKLMEKRLMEISVNVINKPYGFDVTVIPSSLSLTAIGGVDLLLQLNSDDVTAYIDYEKAHISKRNRHLAYIEKIEGIRFTEIKPKYFTLKLKKL